MRLGIVLLISLLSADVPEEYTLWYDAYSCFLDSLDTPPDTFHEMKFGVHLITANPLISVFPEAYHQGTPEHPAFNELASNPFEHWSLDINLKLIDLLSELELDYVKVMMRYPDNPMEKDNYRDIFNRIRDYGFELIIRHDVMGPEYLYINPEAPDAVEKEKAKRKAFIYEIVAQYQPEYLELPEGPTGFRNLLEMLPDIRGWLDEVSPHTKIIMMEGPVYDSQVEKFKALVDNPYIDIVSIHLVELLYPSYRARVEEMASYARVKSKTLWCTDTWLSDGGWAYHGPKLTPEGYNTFTFDTMIAWLNQGKFDKVLEKLDLPWREPLDAQWQRAIVYYAQKLGFQSISPFHIQYFIDYDTSFYTPLGANIKSWKNSLYQGKRTAVYYSYSDIINEVRSHTGVKEKDNLQDLELRIYPNGFKEKIVIGYKLPVKSWVTLQIYDVLGRKIKTLLDEKKPSGYHSLVWDGTDKLGRRVSPGVYFSLLRIDGSLKVRKVVLLR